MKKTNTTPITFASILFLGHRYNSMISIVYRDGDEICSVRLKMQEAGMHEIVEIEKRMNEGRYE